MIARVHGKGTPPRGSDAGGLVRYLYGPGKANDHTDQHMVACWSGEDHERLDAMRHGDGRIDASRLASLMKIPLNLSGLDEERRVYHFSLRNDEGDRVLTDGEWAR